MQYPRKTDFFSLCSMSPAGLKQSKTISKMFLFHTQVRHPGVPGGGHTGIHYEG